MESAWSKLEDILEAGDDKGVVLAVIEAAPDIRPDDSEVLLGPLAESDDTDVASAAWEALAAIDGPPTGKVSLHEDLWN